MQTAIAATIIFVVVTTVLFIAWRQDIKHKTNDINN